MKKYYINSILIILCIVTIFLSLSFVLRVNTNPIDAKIPENTASNTFGNIIQINILNATNQANLASEAQRYFRNLGFDVLEIGNHSEKLDKSVVIDRLGDKISAYKIAYCLGLEREIIKTDIDSSLYLRTTIIIGEDYPILKPFSN